MIATGGDSAPAFEAGGGQLAPALAELSHRDREVLLLVARDERAGHASILAGQPGLGGGPSG